MMRALLAVAIAVALAGAARAATIELVPVGNPGNDGEQSAGPGDPTYYGAVAYPYLIGKYEITNAQWREFLDAKAHASDPYGLYNTRMADLWGGIDRTWSVDHYVYTPKGNDPAWDNRPVNFVSFWDAARFCNWLHNGQGDGDTETGAYANIGDQDNFARLPWATYFIPTEDEWYKAAYYDPDKGGEGVPGYWDYPTMSDAPQAPSNDLTDPDGGNNANYYIMPDDYTVGWSLWSTPVGEFEFSESAYGTFDQGGNASEWNETIRYQPGPNGPVGVLRGIRGGGWGLVVDDLLASSHSGLEPSYEGDASVGFRVASVPEPGGAALMLSAFAAGLIGLRRRR